MDHDALRQLAACEAQLDGARMRVLRIYRSAAFMLACARKRREKYAEDVLKDLSDDLIDFAWFFGIEPEQVERICEEATKDAERHMERMGS